MFSQTISSPLLSLVNANPIEIEESDPVDFTNEQAISVTGDEMTARINDIVEKRIITTKDEDGAPLYGTEKLDSNNILISLEDGIEISIIEAYDTYSLIEFIGDDDDENNSQTFQGFIENRYIQMIDEAEKQSEGEQLPTSGNELEVPMTEDEDDKDTALNFSIQNHNQTTYYGIALRDKTHIYRSQSVNNNDSLRTYDRGSKLKYKSLPDPNWYEASVLIDGKYETGFILASEVENAFDKQDTLRGIALKSATPIYSKAFTSSKIIKSYAEGSILKYKTFSPNWHEATVFIKGKATKGYIHKSHVENAVDKQEALRGIALKSPTHIYNRASISGKKLKSYTAGTILKYKTFSQNWYEATVFIKGKATKGYIHKNHVENALDKQKALHGLALKSPTHIYNRASISGKKLKSYTAGTILKYKTFSQNWYEATVFIKGKATKGYIHKNHVENALDKQKTLHGLALKSPTHIYAKASTSSKILKKYSMRSNLKYKTFSNNWYEATVFIKGKATTGYIHKNHVGDTKTTNYNTSLNNILTKQINAIPRTSHPSSTKMYVHKDALIKDKDNHWVVDGRNWNVRSSPNGTSSSNIIGKVDERYTKGKGSITVYGTSGDFYHFRLGWIIANEADTRRQLDPSKTPQGSPEYYQFLILSGSTGVNAQQVNSEILNNQGILKGKASSFIQASKNYNVNELYLISHASLETGNGTSALSTGVEVGKDKDGKPTQVTTSNRKDLTSIKKTYNMYGIGAVDSCPLKCGSERAYQEGWFTPETAIIGGAKFAAEKYIYAGQDTLYKMRWNPEAIDKNGYASHQYATDISWAVKQARKMHNYYNKLDNYHLTFDVPKYK